MKKNKLNILTLILLICSVTYAQNDFFVIGKTKEVVIPFKLINNLVIIPVNLNGQEFNFILDTGVSSTILFNVEMDEEYDLKQVKKVKIKGLGQGDFYEAIKSENNLLRINEIASVNLSLYYLINSKMDFSARLGVNIHGLIGADFFDDFVVKVNYNKKKIDVYPKNYSYKICKKCQEIPLTFINRKPYIQLNYNNEINSNVKMLVDSGSSDALWFYKDSNLKKDTKTFDDLLGVGISGEIHGRKAKYKKFKFGKFEFKDVITCYPDSISYKHVDKRIKRDGSIGAGLLSRFNIIYDYHRNNIILKKNRSYRKPFLYNMSGLYIKYDGKELVQKINSDIQFKKNEDGLSPVIKYTYDYSFKNSYIISHVKKGSLANKVGLRSKDLIIKINGIHSYVYSLDELNYKLSNDVGKKVRLTILRNNIEYKFTYTIKDLL